MAPSKEGRRKRHGSLTIALFLSLNCVLYKGNSILKRRFCRILQESDKLFSIGYDHILTKAAAEILEYGDIVGKGIRQVKKYKHSDNWKGFKQT